MKTLKVSIKSVNANELSEAVSAFSGRIAFSDDSPDVFSYEDEITPGRIKIRLSLPGAPERVREYPLPEEKLLEKRIARRRGKIEIYDALSGYSGVSLPYGSLTGVRPVKLFYELEREGDAEKILTDEFRVSPVKAAHIKRTAMNQRKIAGDGERDADVYVNVPFCPTRCAYCSFVSVPMKKIEKYLEDYVSTVLNELNIIKKVIKENGYSVRAVYFGGGTPTCIPPESLRRLLSACDFAPVEFTVEAGRPDTVSREILDVLRDCGVSRISVNPQTFHDRTLKLVGREHTVEDFLRAYELASGYGFVLNTDLIAALPGETPEDFAYSLERTMELRPDNVTVHALSLKRGSALAADGYVPDNGESSVPVTDRAAEALEAAGYEPYYMYRLKYGVGGLENTGYSLPGRECLYNADVMGERTSVFAAGAGAVSKRVRDGGGSISRLAGSRDVRDYISRAPLMEQRIRNFWKKD